MPLGWIDRIAKAVQERIENVDSGQMRSHVLEVPYFHPVPEKWYGRDTLIQFVLEPSTVRGQGGNSYINEIFLHVGFFTVETSDDPGKILNAAKVLRNTTDTVLPVLQNWRPAFDWFVNPFQIFRAPGQPQKYPGNVKGVMFQSTRLQGTIAMSTMDYANRNT